MKKQSNIIIKKKPKGRIGVFLEKYFLKFYYGIDFPIKANQQYDLPSALNYKSNKNVSIKCSKRNQIECSTIFNFLSSKNLEMLIIFYHVVGDNDNEILVTKVFLLEKTEQLFSLFNSQMDHAKLLELNLYIKSLRPPYSDDMRNHYKTMSKLLNNGSVLKISCKISTKRRRIQGRFNFTKICKLVKPTLLYENLEIKIEYDQ